MRIAFVCTHPPIECGIGTYTQFLREAMDRQGHETFVVSQLGAQGDGVLPVFWPDDPDFSQKTFGVACKLTPDVVHIQHDFGLYGTHNPSAIVDLLVRLKHYGLPSVVTLHTVHGDLAMDQADLFRLFMSEAGAVVVHEPEQREMLNANCGREDKIHVVRHGIRTVDPIVDAREKLGLGDEKVIVQCGYFRETKNFHKIVELMPRIVDRVPGATYVIAGKLSTLDNSRYVDRLFDAVRRSPVEDHIMVLKGQFPQATFDTIISAADVMALPYTAGYQSGILAHCLAMGKPVVASALPAFRKALEETGAGVCCATDDEYVEGLTRILTDDGYRELLRSNIREHVDQNNWDRIAAKHALLYESLLYYPYDRARYFNAG